MAPLETRTSGGTAPVAATDGPLRLSSEERNRPEDWGAGMGGVPSVDWGLGRLDVWSGETGESGEIGEMGESGIAWPGEGGESTGAGPGEKAAVWPAGIGESSAAWLGEKIAVWSAGETGENGDSGTWAGRPAASHQASSAAGGGGGSADHGLSWCLATGPPSRCQPPSRADPCPPRHRSVPSGPMTGAVGLSGGRGGGGAGERPARPGPGGPGHVDSRAGPGSSGSVPAAVRLQPPITEPEPRRLPGDQLNPGTGPVSPPYRGRAQARPAGLGRIDRCIVGSRSTWQ